MLGASDLMKITWLNINGERLGSGKEYISTYHNHVFISISMKNKPKITSRLPINFLYA